MQQIPQTEADSQAETYSTGQSQQEEAVEGNGSSTGDSATHVANRSSARIASQSGAKQVRQRIAAEVAHGWAFKEAAEAKRPMSDIGARRTYYTPETVAELAQRVTDRYLPPMEDERLLFSRRQVAALQGIAGGDFSVDTLKAALGRK